eukprot:4179532-Alexandrium_andersonii.AAC.1
MLTKPNTASGSLRQRSARRPTELREQTPNGNGALAAALAALPELHPLSPPGGLLPPGPRQKAFQARAGNGFGRCPGAVAPPGDKRVELKERCQRHCQRA